jgi:phosphatidate cytidylyltransferase
MAKRIITGLILAPIVLAIAWYYPDTLGVGLIVGAAFAAAYEYMNLFSVKEHRTLFWGGVCWIVAGPLLARFGGHYLLGYLVASPIYAMGLFLMVPHRIPQAVKEMPVLGLGVLYIGLLMACVVLLASGPQGNSGLLLLFAVVWLGDTAAYFGGKFLGRHKLYERVSPKKTLEGSFFGLLGSVGGAFLIDALFGTPLTPLTLVLVGVGGGVAEQMGDLCESILKRSAGVKDSGKLLPGHGGMLDRIDGLLFAAPVVYGIFLSGLMGG